MAEINLGAIRFNWKGAYAGGTAYVVDDVVSSAGSSYICILASTGNTPPNGTYWNLMAQGGTGSAATLTTTGDMLYRDGSGLQRLGIGTAGQELKVNSGASAPEWYTPYEGDVRGVPPMAPFGDGYRHHVTGLIHDKKGYPTQDSAEIEAFHLRMAQKITRGFSEIQMTREFFLDDAEVIVIAYGSVARSSLRAVQDARKNGIKAGLLQLVTLFPFPRGTVSPLLNQCRAVLVPEMNMGQISREVQRVNQSNYRVVKHNRIDGKFITPNEIFTHLIKL